ncbi:MAG: DUF3604 domain-containing protein [Proteobacteria bacterium]|nr:DUF3604 domain-containing protein [Pseudomonadota bacterium]
MNKLRLLTGLAIMVMLFAWATSRGFWLGEFPLREPTPSVEKLVKTQLYPTQQGDDSQVLFGDLHVHSSISLDAYNMTLPLAGGEGVHPVADACDFARYCSSLDFFSINDHAVNVSAKLWENTKQSIRQCNALSDPQNPDLVAFLGYEWTQVGSSPKDHYGHKNVVFLETADDKVPTHPVAAKPPVGGQSEADFLPHLDQKLLLPLIDYSHFGEYMGFNRYINDIAAHYERPCPVGTPYDQLQEGCMAQAKTPAQLFKLLDEWGGESMVIPHGNTWGSYTPFGTTWDKQLVGDMHDPGRQKLFEIYSGHGNSEHYRPWQHVTINEMGERECPPVTEAFYPGCRRAGDIVFERCQAEANSIGHSGGECLRLAARARQDYVDSIDRAAFMSVPGASMQDWQDSAQCKDCFLPTYELRPGGSAQYAMAIRNFTDGSPRRFDFSFIGSSDNHFARPGTGYKEFSRNGMTEAWTSQQPELFAMLTQTGPAGDQASRVWRDVSDRESMMAGIKQFERQASFFYTGGLVAVHSRARTREEIWQALQDGHVYATSGERQLLWFDLLNADSGAGDGATVEVPMGGDAVATTNPRFRVKAVGAFKQRPGCPDYSVESLDQTALERLCHGECYNPSEERQLITRIEVVRIRPQNYQGEAVDQLIEDKWKVHDCPVDESGCMFEFEDSEFDSVKRDTVYYVRAISEPKPMINGQILNAEYDQSDNFMKNSPCDTLKGGDCLGVNEPRAWSSPIFVAYGTGK